MDIFRQGDVIVAPSSIPKGAKQTGSEVRIASETGEPTRAEGPGLLVGKPAVHSAGGADGDDPPAARAAVPPARVVRSQDCKGLHRKKDDGLIGDRAGFRALRAPFLFLSKVHRHGTRNQDIQADTDRREAPSVGERGVLLRPEASAGFQRRDDQGQAGGRSDHPEGVARPVRQPAVGVQGVLQQRVQGVQDRLTGLRGEPEHRGHAHPVREKARHPGRGQPRHIPGQVPSGLLGPGEERQLLRRGDRALRPG